jgi:hypothetical protein
MNGLFGNKTPTEELVVKEIHGVGLNCFDRQPRRTIYALETWHIYPDRKVLAAIGLYGTKAEAEVIKNIAMQDVRPLEYRATPKQGWHNGLMAKGYLTLADTFQSKQEYLRYMRTVSMHPAAIDKKIMKMEVRG